jgi:flavorubredoxin
MVDSCLLVLISMLCAAAFAVQIKAADTASVAVLYASAYGNTAALAQAISRGVTKAGVGVNTINLELVGVDEVAAVIKEADGFIIGKSRTPANT